MRYPAAMNAPTREPARFTSREFQRMARAGAFADMRVELRRGMLVRMSPQHMPHGRVKAAIERALIAALARAGLAWEVLTEVSVACGDAFEPMPDIVLFDPALVPDARGAVPLGAVRLIVEVADSSLGDDLGEKLEDYAASGLEEYWVADVQGRLILRHAGPRVGGYARREPILFGQPAALLTQPQLVLDTATLA